MWRTGKWKLWFSFSLCLQPPAYVSHPQHFLSALHRLFHLSDPSMCLCFYFLGNYVKYLYLLHHLALWLVPFSPAHSFFFLVLPSASWLSLFLFMLLNIISTLLWSVIFLSAASLCTHVPFVFQLHDSAWKNVKMLRSSTYLGWGGPRVRLVMIKNL